MKVKYTGSHIGPGSERKIKIGRMLTVFQVGECNFHALDENGAPVTLYEDEVELVNPPLNPPTPEKPEWTGADARDYSTDPVYASAQTINQKIETRGQIHELTHATPDD